MPGDEQAGDRAAGKAARQSRFGGQHVDGIEAIENVAPARPVGPRHLPTGEDDIVPRRARGDDIVDRRHILAIAIPGGAPRRLGLIERAYPTIDIERQQQHRRRLQRVAAARQEFPGPRPIEDDAERSDIAGGRKAFALAFDTADHRIELPVGQARRGADGVAGQPGPELRPGLALGNAEGGAAGGLGIGGADIDGNSRNRIGTAGTGLLGEGGCRDNQREAQQQAEGKAHRPSF